MTVSFDYTYDRDGITGIIDLIEYANSRGYDVDKLLPLVDALKEKLDDDELV